MILIYDLWYLFMIYEFIYIKIWKNILSWKKI